MTKEKTGKNKIRYPRKDVIERNFFIFCCIIVPIIMFLVSYVYVIEIECGIGVGAYSEL